MCRGGEASWKFPVRRRASKRGDPFVTECPRQAGRAPPVDLRKTVHAGSTPAAAGISKSRAPAWECCNHKRTVGLHSGGAGCIIACTGGFRRFPISSLLAKCLQPPTPTVFMKFGRLLRLLPLLLLSAADVQAQKPKPEFQYQSGEIRVPIPSADEPRVERFGIQSVKAAVKYLDDGSTAWVREKSCVNCHTTGPYMSERPALVATLGKPLEEIREDFVHFVPGEVKEVKETVTKSGYKHMPGAFTAVWRSLGLAEWDKHLSGKTSGHAVQSLRDMFERQAPSGAFVSHGEVEIPYITTDFELSLQAARAVTAAPGWLENLTDPRLREGVARLKAWLQHAEPKNDWDRVLVLQLASSFPELVSDESRRAALQLLSSKQHTDGGWSTRDFSALEDWHFEVSETVKKLISGLPDAAQPESDAFMTAFAVVLMRQTGVPAADERVQKALAWLKREQRVSGRWWMHSLYRGNYHFTTYIATCQALKALALCGELPAVGGN
jgi:squalene-hopene/tetraprenyl-beta-curcumene cyclase